MSRDHQLEVTNIHRKYQNTDDICTQKVKDTETKCQRKIDLRIQNQTAAPGRNKLEYEANIKETYENVQKSYKDWGPVPGQEHNHVEELQVIV